MLDFSRAGISQLLIRLPVVLLAISVHECAHGYAALKLGDPTAKASGRLTINPLAHFDIFGIICFVVFGFGWAKPVPINPMYFKNKRSGTSIVSFAGPLSNLLLAFLGAVVYGVLLKIGYRDTSVTGEYIFITLSVLVGLNINFAIFNLLPIPPLDGSKILNAFLPLKVYFKILKYERYAFPVLILLLYFNILTPVLSFFSNAIARSFFIVTLFIAGV